MYEVIDEDFPKAAYYNMIARGHWTIDNLLHWHLDVTFMEDAARAKKGYAAQNLSLIRKMALQVVRYYNDKRSIKKRLFMASLSSDYMLELINNLMRLPCHSPVAVVLLCFYFQSQLHTSSWQNPLQDEQ